MLIISYIVVCRLPGYVDDAFERGVPSAVGTGECSCSCITRGLSSDVMALITSNCG